MAHVPTDSARSGSRHARLSEEDTLGSLRPISKVESSFEGHLQIKDVVYRSLVDAIVDLRLRPGQQLRERQLAERMGVSKTPIREVLVRLEKEGLVTVAPYRGAIVRGYTNSDIREIYELRELLEGFCARRAAMQISDTDEAELRHNVRMSRELLSSGRISEIPSLFDAFDVILYRQAAGHRIGKMLAELELHLERLGHLTVEVPGRIDTSVQQHEVIVNAIVMRDPAAAETACRQHVRSVYVDLINDMPANWLD